MVCFFITGTCRSYVINLEALGKAKALGGFGVFGGLNSSNWVSGSCLVELYKGTPKNNIGRILRNDIGKYLGFYSRVLVLFFFWRGV